MRVRAQAELVQLGGRLVVQPGLDEVVGEHAALGEVSVVRLQSLRYGFQRTGNLRDSGSLESQRGSWLAAAGEKLVGRGHDGAGT